MYMKKAEIYLEMVAECPYCAASNTVDWIFESENKYYEWQCDYCEQYFKYCHPENQHGL